LYYSNSSISDWLTWTASITTAPDPPSNLSIAVQSGKVADVAWHPPAAGGFSGFKLKVRTIKNAINGRRSGKVLKVTKAIFKARDFVLD
jgi:cadherin 5 type 2 (VE-cadherin)